ncbi:MAG: DUF481 domain-containing protein [Saprospiraceae bacterium]|uniref:DUF481 domain-containing protein n=1 Tax=Candidatus Opimibacter skivensis TaxID=2982028 RepID=A0A9D7SWQ6_9BACT|nr:DUF481 domain-containing protein [Candidatus Opimibacter skivensis]
MNFLKSWRYLGIAILIAFSSSIKAQIVNIERLRIPDDSTGWLGTARLNFSGSRSTKSYIALSTGTLLEYKSKKNKDLWLFITDFNLVSAEGEKFSNSGWGHIRYNHKLGKAIRWEIFSQLQYNKLTKIKQRAIAGTGPRFKLTQYDDAHFYLGVAYMFEYEEDAEVFLVHRDSRLSSYFTFTLSPEETVTFTSTTYGQPLFADFKDYRVSNETSFP